MLLKNGRKDKEMRRPKSEGNVYLEPANEIFIRQSENRIRHGVKQNLGSVHYCGSDGGGDQDVRHRQQSDLYVDGNRPLG